MSVSYLSDPSEAATTTPSTRPTWRVWIRRVAVWLLMLVLGISISGSIYQTIATTIDRSTYLAPGKVFDIGEQGKPLRLHLNCVGQGSPTVILESGQGGLSSDWVWVQQGVIGSTRICAYDRAGVGWSDSGPTPRDGDQIVKELHALLEKAEIPGPYLLVGHSYGGLYVRLFAATYADEVAGVVLVDSTHPQQWQHLPGAQEQVDYIQSSYWKMQALYRLGVHRLINFNSRLASLPPKQAAERKAMMDRTPFVDTAAKEFAASEVTFEQVINAGTLGAMPLYVLSATGHDAPAEAEQAWACLQAELAALSTNSVHHIVQGATHSSLLLEKGDAQATVAAILAVVEAVRTGELLGAKSAR